MRSSKLVHMLLVSLLLLLTGVLSVSAAPDEQTHYSINLKNVTIPWYFPPPDGMNNAVCAEIPVGLSINPDDLGSNRRKQASEITNPNGVKRILTRDVITGTATDNFGDTYHFTYRNRVVAHYDGAVVHIKMIDYFRLKGDDHPDADFTLRFTWLWAYEADSLDVVEVRDETGRVVNLELSTFFFPTADGVNESPDIIPGSWRSRNVQGNPFCDPL